jgi:hypothetical protein
MSWILAILGEATTGSSTPGMALNGLARSSALTDAASFLASIERSKSQRRSPVAAEGRVLLLCPKAPLLGPPPAGAERPSPNNVFVA